MAGTAGNGSNGSRDWKYLVKLLVGILVMMAGAWAFQTGAKVEKHDDQIADLREVASEMNSKLDILLQERGLEFHKKKPKAR